MKRVVIISLIATHFKIYYLKNFFFFNTIPPARASKPINTKNAIWFVSSVCVDEVWATLTRWFIAVDKLVCASVTSFWVASLLATTAFACVKAASKVFHEVFV